MMKSKEKGKKKTRRFVLIIAAVVALLAVGYIILCNAVKDNVIWESTSINGISLKNLTVEQAEESVLSKFEEDYKDAAVTVVLDDQEYQVNIFPLLGMDASGEIREAYKFGHGSWISRGVDWIRSKISRVGSGNLEIAPVVQYPEKLDEVIAASGIQGHNSVVETTYEVTESELIIHKGSAGATPDVEQLKQQLTAAIEENRMEEKLSCPFTENQPGAVDFQAIADESSRAAVSASLDPNNNYAVIPSSTGVSVDAAQVQEAYSQAAEGTDVVVPLTVTQPEITTEDLQANLFKDVLGSYQSTAMGNGGREHNIGLAVGFCNGVILLPGETFSYNAVVGNTTLERGFQLANAYSNGQVVQEPGGGVCQVSSTMFSALLQTDIEIVQRRYHSMIVTYVPYGMDATVSWDQPDFRFKNNHKYPIKLSLSFVDGVLSVQVLGTKESDLTVDCRVEQTGELEFVTYRDYYDAGGNLVNTEYITTSKYKPVS